MLLVGDCRQVLRELPDNHVHAIATDPPYHLTRGKKGGTGVASLNPRSPAGRSRIGTGFMGKGWDGGGVAFEPATWAEALRVARPGAYMAAFGGTRTHHRLMVAIEDGGWEIRDVLMWVYGSGFPKSYNLDGDWDGHGTALKPSWEPIVLARKPFKGSVRKNLERWGCGVLDIDGCRIPTDESLDGGAYSDGGRAAPSVAVSSTGMGRVGARAAGEFVQPPGRWPANLVHDGSVEVVEAFPRSAGGKGQITGNESSSPTRNTFNPMQRNAAPQFHGRVDTAARFYYCAKARGDERGDGNDHPTVKPLELMRWLVRLITPRAGVVLDPFTGSGTTWLAADAEGKGFVGIELEQSHADIVLRRRTNSQGGLDL